MKRLVYQLVIVVAGICVLQNTADAQPPGRPNNQPGQGAGPGRRGPGSGPQGQTPPMMRIFDLNEDGELSAEEIDRAAKSLRKLDRNSDGKLTVEEFRAMSLGNMRPGSFGQGQQGQGQRGQRPPGQGRPEQGQPEQGRVGQGGQRGGQGARPRDRVRQRDTAFLEKFPIGSTLPESLQLYNVDRKLVPANSIFKAKYTVVVGGCLTCPEYRNSYPEIEAVAADYRDKDVQFYFLFQSLTHPENWGYVQPTSIQERFAQVDHAKDLLKTTIPWLTDTMDNEMKAFFEMTPNSQFVFDSEGRIVHRDSWGRGSSLRESLEKLVGPSRKITTFAELNLPTFRSQRTSPADMLVERKTLEGVAVPLKVAAGGEELVVDALKSTDFEASNRYAKLRPEADQELLRTGSGTLYLGFRQDPILGAAWNNLASPPKYRVIAEGVTVTPAMAAAEKLDVDSDTEPREFLLDVRNWQAGEPIQVEIQYFACNKEKGWCKAVTQEFTVWLEQDRTAGLVNGRSHFPGGNRNARPGQHGRGQGRFGQSGQGRPGQGRPGQVRPGQGPGRMGQGRPGPPGGGSPGGRNPAQEDAAFAAQLIELDENQDSFLSREELPDHMQAAFQKADLDKNGKLDESERLLLAAEFRRSKLRPEGSEPEVKNAPVRPGSNRPPRN